MFRLFNKSIKIYAKTIYPPTIKMEFMLSSILEDKMFSFFVWEIALMGFGFPYILRNTKPFINDESRWAERRIYPTFILLNSAIPTVPIINMGPETEQNASIFFADISSILPDFLASQISFAPTGYPDNKLNR